MRWSHVVSVTLAAAGLSSNALAQSSAVATSACALAATSGVAEQRLDSGGRQRSYRLFVPQGYDGRTPLALVLDLHGSGGTAAGQAGTSRFEALAAREGFAVATLQAGAEGNRWNVPLTDGRPDDVQYVSDVIDHVAARVCTDSHAHLRHGLLRRCAHVVAARVQAEFACRGHRADGGTALAGPV